MSGDSAGGCWQCAGELEAAHYGRRESCPGCGAETKVCRNCAHYQPGISDECREPAAERVFDKEKANFCEFFKPTRPAARGSARAEKSGEAKSAFDALFKQAEE